MRNRIKEHNARRNSADDMKFSQQEFRCVYALLPVLILGLNQGLRSEGFPVSLNSPDGNLKLELNEGARGTISLSFEADGRKLLDPSPCGLDKGILTGVSQRSVNAVWKPLWGKRAQVPERFNEVTIDMASYRIVARAYNEGVAFRTLSDANWEEPTRLNFAGDFTAWYYNGERHNLGPEKLSASEGGRKPVMLLQAGKEAFLALHEADLPDGADPMTLWVIKGANAIKLGNRASQAWRVLLYGRTPGDLVDSHLIELLTPPPQEGMDFSWVKPGVTLWDWRINGAKVDGFNYAMSYPSWIRMVDFAAENQFAYLLLDADWYGKEFARESNPTGGGYAGDARKLITYAKEKNVGILLYLNDVAGRAYPIEETLKTYRAWGAAGIKYGFMNGKPAEKNALTQKITRLCAENRLVCDFHDGPVHPFGQMRTWPNAVTREYCQAQLDGHKVFQPKTFVTSVFVNMLAGPLDMNNGVADLTQKGRVDNGSPVPSTLCAEAARTLIAFSGLICIPDIPENYRTHPELLRFYRSMKMPWQESKTLSGVIGEYIVMARQAKDGNWLIGAATSEDPRELDIPLAFLGPGEFDAMIVQDGDDSDYRTHCESCKASKRTVKRTDTIRVKLAPGGGAVALIKPKP